MIDQIVGLVQNGGGRVIEENGMEKKAILEGSTERTCRWIGYRGGEEEGSRIFACKAC